MSVDDRLRGAFQTGRAPEENTAHHLARVHARARQETLRRRTVAVGAVAAAAVAVLVFSMLGGNEPRTEQPIDAPMPSPTALATAGAVDELHEWWRTPKLTDDQLRHTLESAGLGQYSDVVIDDLPAEPRRLTLSIQGSGFWTLTANKGDSDEMIDRENVTADGSTLVISPAFASGQSTYDYAIKTNPTGKRTLRLTFVETTEGESHGIPGEAFQRALYTTAVFREVNN